jgi:mitochondrial import inner membrane translocase subunit TIM22
MYRPGTGTHLVGATPIYVPGKEPLPPGFGDNERQVILQNWQFERYASKVQESCAVKTAMSGAGGALAAFLQAEIFKLTARLILGFAIGAFFSLMSASFAYEDPYLRSQTQAGMNNVQKAREIFKDMGKGMVTTGKGFAKVGALFAGIECVIEGVRTLHVYYTHPQRANLMT